MTDEQKEIYEEEKSKARNLILENIHKKGINNSSFMILQALTKLRQLANHPVLTYDDYRFESGKFNEITRNLENLGKENHKVLIFSTFVKHLDLFARHLDENNLLYSKLTGSTRNREEVVRQFQENEENRYFLISLKAGGTGLNLTAADYVFILDPWWNPAAESQAINRAHRIGQYKNVMAYKFISSETIEEKILNLQQRKILLAEKFVDSNNPLGQLSEQEIIDLFN